MRRIDNTYPWKIGTVQPYVQSRRVMLPCEVDVNIIVDKKQIDKIVTKHNTWFVSPHPDEAKPYIIRIKNHFSERIVVEVKVDGVCVMTGKEDSDSGYIIKANDHIDIKGWRTSMDDVAQFVFTNDEESYASLTQRRNDIGTIVVTAYAEQRSSGWHNYITREATLCSMSCKSGTGYGNKISDSVVSVGFDRDLSNKIILVYKYNHREALIDNGVIPAPPSFVPPPPENVIKLNRVGW